MIKALILVMALLEGGASFAVNLADQETAKRQNIYCEQPVFYQYRMAREGLTDVFYSGNMVVYFNPNTGEYVQVYFAPRGNKWCGTKTGEGISKRLIQEP